MSPASGETHQEAVRLPPAEPSERQLSVGPTTRICPCLLTPEGAPSNATKASLASSALALGHGCPGEQVPSISRAAMPDNLNLGPSWHQIGPSPSHTCVGVQAKVWPFGMIGTSASAGDELIIISAEKNMAQKN